jgi:hypothetical protein
VPRAKLACVRVGDDVDVMVAQLGRPALRLLSGPAACMAASWRICMARVVIPPHVIAKVLAPQAVPHVMTHSPVRVGGSSCEVDTCRARQRLVGGDPPCGELVGDAANWSEA